MPVDAMARIPHLDALPKSARITVLRFIDQSLNQRAGTERILCTLAIAKAHAHRQKGVRRA